MKKLFYYITLILLLSSSSIFAEEKGLIEVSAEVDTSIITIGDRINYSIIIDRQKDLRIARPGEGLNLGMFEIKDYNFPEAMILDDRVIERFDFSISVYDTGKYAIPPFPVAYFLQPTDTVFSIIEAPAIDIFVQSVLTGEDAAELRDVKAPLDVPFNYFFWIIVITVVVLVALSIWFIFYLIKKRREKGYLFTPPTPPRPAHQIALEALDELYASDLVEQKSFKEFFSRLSQILRVYLEGRFYFSAMEETSAEILAELQKHVEQEDLNIAMQQVLSLSDLVKFAKYKPHADEIDPAKEQAKIFVNETKIIFEKQESDSNNSDQEIPVITEEPIEQNQISGGA